MNPTSRALEIAELAAPDACQQSQRLIAFQIDDYTRTQLADAQMRVSAMQPIVNAAIIYEQYLTKMEPFGAASHSHMCMSAYNLRNAISAYQSTRQPTQDKGE